MGIIELLDAQTANRIAAGEVVDRPAGALKELIENALDAGATKLSVEIKGGGRGFLRITDNGRGFYRDDMPKALMRHATSKIRSGSDLQEIATFGFRGEALAAISSVSRMEIISCARGESVGTRLTSDENGIVMTDTGCPEGTTVLMRDLFYNMPARQKFLKRDATEAAACVAVASRAALSHPEVSFTVTVEGEKRFYTAGDGKLLPAIRSVYGREFSVGLVPVSYALDGVKAEGYITPPDKLRGSRSMQIFFVNGRPVQSKTIMAALEEGFRSYLPHGKYPGAVLFVSLPIGATDVNVHPAKLEIKFANERPVFSAVYYAVKNCLQNGEKPKAEITSATETEAEERAATAEQPAAAKRGMPTQESVQAAIHNAVFTAPAAVGTQHPKSEDTPPASTSREPYREASRVAYEPRISTPRTETPRTEAKRIDAPNEVFRSQLGLEDLGFAPSLRLAQDPPKEQPHADALLAELSPADEQLQMESAPYHKLIGEAYDAYLFVETENEVLVIDKHAAHERILYEKLAARKEVHTQRLLASVPLELEAEDAQLLLANAAYLQTFGFLLEAYRSSGNGDNSNYGVAVCGVPSTLSNLRDLQAVLETFARELAVGGSVSFAEKCDRALFTVACKAALKAGIPNAPQHNEWIVQQLLENPALRFCPHGRPVLHALPKRQIEQFFDR